MYKRQLPYLGWTGGTLIGALLGSVLPDRLMSALGIAIYGMFIAIVVPEMKHSHPVVCTVLCAVLMRCAFDYIPFLENVSDGIAITVCAVVSAAASAALFPVEES